MLRLFDFSSLLGCGVGLGWNVVQTKRAMRLPVLLVTQSAPYT